MFQMAVTVSWDAARVRAQTNVRASAHRALNTIELLRGRFKRIILAPPITHMIEHCSGDHAG